MVIQGDGSCKTDYDMRWMWKGEFFLIPLSFVRLSGRIVLSPNDLLYGSQRENNDSPNIFKLEVEFGAGYPLLIVCLEAEYIRANLGPVLSSSTNAKPEKIA
jgi:hypothetical protein